MIFSSYLHKVDYVTSSGTCRGGNSPENYAGIKTFHDKACRERCNMNFMCTGFVLPVPGTNDWWYDWNDWCQTYTSIGATGNGDMSGNGYTCYMKEGNVISYVCLSN